MNAALENDVAEYVEVSGSMAVMHCFSFSEQGVKLQMLNFTDNFVLWLLRSSYQLRINRGKIPS